MSKRRNIALLCAVLLALGLTACGSSAAKYKDGTYEGKSQVYEGDEDGKREGGGVVGDEHRPGERANVQRGAAAVIRLAVNVAGVAQ